MVDKLRDKYWYYDGRKSILLEQYPDSAWTFLSNGPQNDELDYYKFIPTLYRAATIRGNEIAAMPFEIYKGNSEEPYDSSNDYQNNVGFMKNPYQLLQLVEMALVLTGRAYLFKERSRAAPKDLRYIIPTSVTPKIDPIKGLEYFERPVGATIQRFTTDDIVYFWMPDPYVELGPALHYPGQAAANACGVLINIDLFASHFFERGAIKAMLLTVKGMTVQSEREKLETWFQSFVGGIRNAWRAKVVNADLVTPVVVGEGMKELENQQVTTEKREDICLALGVPQTLLFANSANFATAQQDELNFLNGTIIPECTFIASILNEQIFEPLGYHWEFLPESLDAMQEDEQSRSGALVQLVSALADPISEVAMDILGYELSDEQMAKLQEIWKQKQEQAEQMAQLAAMAPKQEEEKPEEEKPEDEGEKPNPFEEKMKIDLEKWKVKSLKRLREGESAAVEFVSDFIPAEKNAEILFNLAECKTAEDVRRVFGVKYSDDQPRDETGKWTDGGGGESSGGSKDGTGDLLTAQSFGVNLNSSREELENAGYVAVFRGTNSSGIDTIRSSPNGVYGEGVYFYDDPKAASAYVEAGGGIVTAFVPSFAMDVFEKVEGRDYHLVKVTDKGAIIRRGVITSDKLSGIEKDELYKYADSELDKKWGGYKIFIDPMLALVAELKRANDILEAEMKYSDDQPRDETGKWTDGGGGGDQSPKGDGGGGGLSYISSGNLRIEKSELGERTKSRLDKAGIPPEHTENTEINFSHSDTVGDDGSTLGHYNIESETIELGNWAFEPDFQSNHTEIHEIGHHVHLSQISDETASKWESISDKYESSWSENFDNQGEFFAERYADYYGSSATRFIMSEREPEVYDFFHMLDTGEKVLFRDPDKPISVNDKERRYDKHWKG